MESVKTDHELFDRRILIQPRFLTSAELAGSLNVSEHTIRSWRKFRVITPLKFGRSVRWALEDVLQELTLRSSK